MLGMLAGPDRVKTQRLGCHTTLAQLQTKRGQFKQGMIFHHWIANFHSLHLCQSGMVVTMKVQQNFSIIMLLCGHRVVLPMDTNKLVLCLMNGVCKIRTEVILFRRLTQVERLRMDILRLLQRVYIPQRIGKKQPRDIMIVQYFIDLVTMQ